MCESETKTAKYSNFILIQNINMFGPKAFGNILWKIHHGPLRPIAPSFFLGKHDEHYVDVYAGIVSNQLVDRTINAILIH